MSVPPSAFPGCQRATDWVDWPAGTEKLLIEPKLDGYRLLVVVDRAGRVSFHCGKPEQAAWAENLVHIAQAVRATGVRAVMLDGAVMADTWSQTSSLIRRKRGNMDAAKKEQIVREVRFHAFDAIPLDVPQEMRKLPRRRKEIAVIPVPLTERRGLLEQILTRHGDSRVLRPVPQFTVFSPQQLYSMHDELVDFEYEGTMVKVPESPYAFDRVSFWQKMKPTETIEMRITGAVEGKGKNAKRLGAFQCELVDSPGVQANCGGGFSDEMRSRLWHSWQGDPTQLIGRIIEAKVQDSPVAKAQHSVFLRFRDDDSASKA